MINSPKVILNCKFTYAKNSPDNPGDNNSVDRKVSGMFDYYSNVDKRAMSMFDYFEGNINKTETMNLVIEDGTYASKEEIESRKRKYIKYLDDSHLWQGVISFNNDYINENIKLEDLEQKLIKDVIPRFFKECGFKDIKNMSYQIALHTDTDNLHFHFSFIEKKPNYEYARKTEYRRMGKLSDSEINFMKNEIVHIIEKEKVFTPLLKETNMKLEELKKYFNPKEKNFLIRDKKDLVLEANILRLGELLYQKRFMTNKRIKFNSITDAEIKELTKVIKRYLFSKNNDSLGIKYEDFKKSIKDINAYFYNINVDNQVKNIKLDTKLTDSKSEHIDNYIYNAIVNSANYNFKRKVNNLNLIKEKDVVQEIILQEYLKSKKWIVNTF